MPSNWLDHLTVDHRDLRTAHSRRAQILNRLAADKPLLTELVHGIEHNPRLLHESEVHPLIHRLVLYQDDARGFQIRLHLSPGHGDELVPHDHKYSFTTRILAGAYTHVWRRRTDTSDGEFTAADLTPGIVTIERPDSCYTLGHPLVHQTLMLPGTVTLFMRGPREKDRSHAALDMLPQADTWPSPAEAGKPKHAGGQRPVTGNEYRVMRDQLAKQGIITR
ncbi:hypothetical protein [Streptomyces albireticuli]|uniref:hypothetical protein n=1 Tax=Streptomyces albireticuli TaxID=1940 RepID=UPI0036AFF180